MPISRPLIFLAASFALCSAALAHEYQAGDLKIIHPHARPTVPGQTNGAAYMDIVNRGKSPDKLTAIASPAADSAQVHTMSLDNNVMAMREVSSLDIAPGTEVAMVPGKGYHVMLNGLKHPLNPGDKFPMTLTFEKAGKLEVSVMVDKAAQ